MSAAAPRSRRRPSGAPTVADVARLAGCSPMTVSRVTNGDTGVRPATRDAVMSAIESLNYTPNSAARSLAGARATRLGLLYANPSAAYLSEVLVGALDEASRTGAQILLEKWESYTDGPRAVDRLIAARVDGVLLPPPLCDTGSVLVRLEDAGVPAVAIGPGTPSDGMAAVTMADREAARQMTGHLIDLGHRIIGFIVGNRSQTASEQRQLGYMDAMAAAGLPFGGPRMQQGEFTYQSGRTAAERLLDLRPRPTAIFASNDDMAAAVVAVAHRRGLDVPRDLSVAGFDDTAIATTLWPELTTVHQPVADMTRAAVELLTARIDAERAGEALAPQHRVLDHRLVLRASAGPPP